MKMTQTSVCTAHFVESRITSGALSKNTFIVIMVWTMKLHNHVCICIHIIIGTECAPVISNSTSIDYVHDLDQQEVAIDDYLDESDSFEDEKWKCAKFLLHVTEEHHRGYQFIQFGSMACRLTILSSKGEDKCTSI